MHSGSPRVLSFSGHTLDLQRCAVTRGDREIQLRPKAFDVLRYLAEHAGRVVSKEELIKAAWPDIFVTDDSLVQCIKDIREALSDNAHQIIKTMPRRGYLFAAELTDTHLNEPQPTTGTRGQEITFCRTKDGVNIAVACVGQGMPLVCIPTWATHLEHDWQSPIRGPLCRFLAERFRLVRYDGRGFGLSDRNVNDISFDTFGRDLEAVVDALGLRNYALLGISQGAATAIAHAARHPGRVSKVVLHGGATARLPAGPASLFLMGTWMSSQSSDRQNASIGPCRLRLRARCGMICVSAAGTARVRQRSTITRCRIDDCVTSLMANPSLDGGSAAIIRHVREAAAGPQPEELAGKMPGVPGPDDANSKPRRDARDCVRKSESVRLLDRPLDHQCQGKHGHERDRLEVLLQIVTDIAHKMLEDRQFGSVPDEQRMAVGAAQPYAGQFVAIREPA